ncbi:MAG: aldehyde dehydrogenase [Rhodobacteraceae bacterium]|jgi:acyl-CoA reductase-like NAD-dependent aldehyde dehydrogenase|nr:aldehyde dehydrogenase [Paracoccaceae bacterium]
MRRYGFIAGGAEHLPAAGKYFDTVSPISGETWAQIAECGAADVALAVGAASTCFETVWSRLSPTARGKALLRFAEVIAEHARQIAEIETCDNGKLLKETSAQLGVVPDWFRYFGGLADKIEGRVVPLNGIEAFGMTKYEPLGVVGVITPWNSPVLLTTLAVAPALAAGNTVVIKPSEVASASVLEFALLARKAGLPDGAINVVTGFGEAGAALTDHPDVRQMTFTGGEGIGRRVAAAAAGRVAPTVMELGGKSANIVFADANLDQAEAGVLAGIFGAGGQTCIAGSRTLIQRPVFEAMRARLATRAGRIRLGDPMEATTEMGPLVSADHRKLVVSKIAAAVAGGARLVAGGNAPDRPGYFLEPTIVEAGDAQDYIMQNEVFGPVLALYPFDTEDEAVRIANASPYGLAAGVWSRDVARCHRMVDALKAGTVWVNMYRAMTFNMPFGGFKQSGYGRLNGQEAIMNYLQTKAVWIDRSDRVQDPFSLKTE